MLSLELLPLLPLILASASANDLVFAGIRLRPPLSSSLRRLGISQPTPIQAAAIAPLTAGASCILHAETGSGKTLAYLLPLLKRLLGSGPVDSTPFQAVVVVPTKELAVQVAADIKALLGADALDQRQHPLIHLCIGSSGNIRSPIVVGTPFRLLEVVTDPAFKDAIEAVRYLVVDEVDRLLAVPGRYAPTEALRQARKESTPTVRLLEALVKSRGGLDKANVQFVAASATIGRPLRRSLSKLLLASNEYADFAVIRPEEESSSEGGADRGRRVSIPASIEHRVVMSEGDSDQLTGKLATAKEVWRSAKARRGILFVPSAEDVKQVVGVLQFWGVREAADLQQSLGISSPKPIKGSAPARMASSGELISRAVESGIGSVSRIAGAVEGRELFVLPVSGARGLHIQDAQLVLVLTPPHTMDEVSVAIQCT